MEIIFVGEAERVETLEIDENPVHVFPSMPVFTLHRDARAQLYSIITGTFFDEALGFELLHLAFTDDGPYIYRLDQRITDILASLDEDRIGEYAELWLECEEVESLDPETNDLYEFLYQLASFCYSANNEEDLGVYVYSDD